MLLGSARTLEREHPAVVFEVERKLFAEHEPRAPIRLLRDRYKYTCFKPVPCGTQPRSFFRGGPLSLSLCQGLCDQH